MPSEQAPFQALSLPWLLCVTEICHRLTVPHLPQGFLVVVVITNLKQQMTDKAREAE